MGCYKLLEHCRRHLRGVGAGVAGTGESAPSFLESSFFGLMYGPRLPHHGTDAVARAKLALPNGLLRSYPNAAGAPSRRFSTFFLQLLSLDRP